MDPTLIVVAIAIVLVVAVVVLVLKSRSGKALPPEERDEPSVPAKQADRAPEPAPKRATPRAESPAEPSPATAPEPAASAEAASDAAMDRETSTMEIEPEPVSEPEIDTDFEEEPPSRPSARPKKTASEDELKALKKGLKSTRGGFISRLAKLFGKREEIDPELLEELEEVLITADVGVKTSQKILADLKERMDAGDLSDPDAIWAALRTQARTILGTEPGGMPIRKPGPMTVLVVGVNGVGKTTTIGKLASIYKEQGHEVVLAAGDTFRAAAVAQLEVWGRKVGCEVVKGKSRADPASVIYDAVKRGQEHGADIVIADTAGRLHTKTNLMEELKKVVRTAEKALGRPADEILLVLDSTTGQNAVQQAQLFRDALDVSGLVLTKLDGTAKGGVVLGIVDEHQIPVRFIGIGEKVEDLRAFDAAAFVEALFTKPDDESIAA